MRGLVMFIIKPHVCSTSIHVRCDTLYTCLQCIYLLFMSCPHRMVMITNVLRRRLKILASNTYTCTTLLCNHTLYSILIVMHMNIAIAFTCRSGKNPQKITNLDSWSIQWHRVAMVPVHWRSSALKVWLLFQLVNPFFSNKSSEFLYYQFVSPWKLILMLNHFNTLVDAIMKKQRV